MRTPSLTRNPALSDWETPVRNAIHFVVGALVLVWSFAPIY